MRMEQPLRQSSGVNLSERFRQLVQRAQGLTEATLRHEFVQSLHEFVLQATGYDPLPQLEEQIALPAEFGAVLRGRSDARLGCLVCEIKTPEHPLDDAITQCHSYLDCYRQQGIFARGVAYNGIELALISETGVGIWRGKAEEGAFLLEAWLLLLALKIVDPQHLVLLLGFPSLLARTFIADLLNAFRNHERLGFVEEAFKVWQAVYGAVANLTDEAVNALSWLFSRDWWSSQNCATCFTRSVRAPRKGCVIWRPLSLYFRPSLRMTRAFSHNPNRFRTSGLMRSRDQGGSKVRLMRTSLTLGMLLTLCRTCSRM